MHLIRQYESATTLTERISVVIEMGLALRDKALPEELISEDSVVAAYKRHILGFKMLTQADLEQFCGTENYYRHWLRRFNYTDGVKYLADKGGAYWLIDAIASHQTSQLLRDPMLQEIQFWELQVNPDRSAVLRCLRDTNDVALTQNIPFTDFPLDSIKLYLTEGVLMLPSEY